MEPVAYSEVPAVDSPLAERPTPAPPAFLPRNRAGLFYLASASSLTAAALLLSATDKLWPWLAGQLLLAIVLIQWLAVLHEAGHRHGRRGV